MSGPGLGHLLQEAFSDYFMHPQAQGLGLSLDMEKNMKTGSVLVQEAHENQKCTCAIHQHIERVPPGLLILKECIFEALMGGVTGARVGFEEGVSAGGIHMLHAVYHLFFPVAHSRPRHFLCFSHPGHNNGQWLSHEEKFPKEFKKRLKGSEGPHVQGVLPGCRVAMTLQQPGVGGGGCGGLGSRHMCLM